MPVLKGLAFSLLFLSLLFGWAYLFLSGMRPRIDNRNSHWLNSVPVAHRGLHGNGIPENSLAAFRKAAENGYAVELDVRLTGDGRLAVFHDEDLLRMTGTDKKFSECSWPELAELSLEGTDHRIPLFTDVLQEIDGKVPLLVEIKNDDSPGPLEDILLLQLENYNGEIAVQSFNPLVLRYIRSHAPEILRGQLSGRFRGEDLVWYKKVLLRNLLLNRLARPDFIAYDIGDLPFGRLSLLRRHGVVVLAWTVRDSSQLNDAGLYSDNLIFENIRP